MTQIKVNLIYFAAEDSVSEGGSSDEDGVEPGLKIRLGEKTLSKLFGPFQVNVHLYRCKDCDLGFVEQDHYLIHTWNKMCAGSSISMLNDFSESINCEINFYSAWR